MCCVASKRYQVIQTCHSIYLCSLILMKSSSSTTGERHFVAVKVFRSDDSDAEDLTSKLDRLRPSPRGSDSRGERHVEIALDSFFLEGRQDGQQHRNLCRVVEPLGRSLDGVLDEASDQRTDLNFERDPTLNFNPQRVLEGDPWTVRFARRACWQLLLGLDHLHKHRLAHRDLCPANVSLALMYNLASHSENEIQKRGVWPEDQPEGTTTDSAAGTSPVEGSKGASDQEGDGPDTGTGDEEEDSRTNSESESDSESDSNSDSEGSTAREERLQKEKKQEEEKRDIEEQWRELELDPGDESAEPHSAAWNKANFRESRAGAPILLRPRTDPGWRDPNQPRYIVGECPLEDGFTLIPPATHRREGDDFRLVLGDLGLACPFDECEANPRAGQGLIDFMPPEWHLGLPTGHEGDVFSLGLLFWEVVMQRRLVETSFRDGDDRPQRLYARSRLVRDLAQRLGPLPADWRTHLHEADKFVDAQGRALDFLDLEGSAEEVEDSGWTYGPEHFDYGDIWHQARWRKPLDMSNEELNVFLGLLGEVLQWRPEARPSTSELLRHEWFQGLEE